MLLLKLLVLASISHFSLSSPPRLVGFESKNLSEDYYFEYSSNALDSNGGALGPETLEFHCALSCLDKLGKHRCLSIGFNISTGICTCGFIDYNNYLTPGNTITVTKKINKECQKTEGKTPQNLDKSVNYS